MNISCRIANANTQCGRITNPPERDYWKMMLNRIYIAVIILVIGSCECHNSSKEEYLYGNWELYYIEKTTKEEYKYVIRDSSYIIMSNEPMKMSIEKEHGRIAKDSFMWEIRNDTLHAHILNNPQETVSAIDNKKVTLNKNMDVLYLSSEYDKFYNMTYVFNKR